MSPKMNRAKKIVTTNGKATMNPTSSRVRIQRPMTPFVLAAPGEIAQASEKTAFLDRFSYLS